MHKNKKIILTLFKMNVSTHKSFILIYFQVIRVFYVETIMIRKQLLPENWFEIKDQYLEMMENMKMQNLTVISDTSNATAPGNASGFDIDKIMAKIKFVSEKDDKVELLWSVTVAIFVLFGMIGAFASGKFADYFGR